MSVSLFANLFRFSSDSDKSMTPVGSGFFVEAV